MNGDGEIRRRSRYESRPSNAVGSRDTFRASARNAICLPAVGVKTDRSNGNERKEDGASHAVELARKQGRTRDATRLGECPRGEDKGRGVCKCRELKPAPNGAGFITERGKDGRETTAAGGEGK